MTLLRIAVVLAGFLAAGIAFLPLRLVYGLAPIPADTLVVGQVSGTVWKGELREVRWDKAELGSFRLQTEAASLLGGRLRIRFTADGPVSSGEVVASPGELLLLNLAGEIPLTRLAPRAPQEATVRLMNGALDMEGRACARAGGRVSIDGLAALGMGMLEGPMTCEAGRLVLALAPQGGGASADILIDLAGSGETRISARSRDSVMQALIASLGVPVEGAASP